MSTKNVMTFEGGWKAVVAYDPDLGMFRGEFVDLNGGADFYASDVEGLKREGAESLRIFLDECRIHGVNPRKASSGHFSLRLDSETYQLARQAAKASGISLNAFIAGAVKEALAQ